MQSGSRSCCIQIRELESFLIVVVLNLEHHTLFNNDQVCGGIMLPVVPNEMMTWGWNWQNQINSIKNSNITFKEIRVFYQTSDGRVIDSDHVILALLSLFFLFPFPQQNHLIFEFKLAVFILYDDSQNKGPFGDSIPMITSIFISMSNQILFSYQKYNCWSSDLYNNRSKEHRTGWNVSVME